MKILGIIPARLNSNRLPRKPLFKLNGIECFLHVYFRAKLNKKLTDIVLATDSEIIMNIANKYSINSILTSEKHQNPTERIIEVKKHRPNYDLYVLINGDEVLLNPDDITESINCLENSNDLVSLLKTSFNKTNSISDFKVVCDKNDHVLYISRSDIPQNKNNNNNIFQKAYHLMTFKPEALDIYEKLERSYLENFEDHEHLRFIENGIKIKTKLVNSNTISLDCPDDVNYIENLLSVDPLFLEYKNLY